MADVSKRPWEPLQVITLEGSPYERGVCHGRLMREAIGEALSLWERAYVQDAFGVSRAEFALEVERRTDFYPAIKRWTPDLLDELKGIADGAGLDVREIYAFNVADECYELEGLPRPEHCSSIGVWRSESMPAVVAQTLDIEPYWDGLQLVQRIVDPDGSSATLVLSYPGLIGMNGMSGRGFGLCMNSLSELASAQSGLPVTMVIRGALAAADLEAAVRFLSDVPHATGQNYVLASGEGVVDLECSSIGATRYMPNQTSGVLLHTNSPLASCDYRPGCRPRGRDQRGRQAELVADSDARMKSMDRYVAGGGSHAGLAPVKRALRSVAKHGGSAEYLEDDLGASLSREHMRISYTFGTSIMELGDTPRLHISSRAWESDEYLIVEC